MFLFFSIQEIEMKTQNQNQLLALKEKSQSIRQELSIRADKKIKNDAKRWWTLNESFTDDDLIEHLNGNATYGYFSKKYSKVICIDIDLHHSKSFENLSFFKEASSEVTLVKYLNKIFHFEPSLIFRTRVHGGLHLYYLLKKLYCIDNLQYLFKKKLKDLVKEKYIEVYPKKNKGLRIPLNVANDGWALNRNFERISKPSIQSNIDFFKDLLTTCHRYSFDDFKFEIPKTISILIEKTAEKKNTQKAVSEQSKLIRYQRYQDKHEQTLSNGTTNDFIKNATYNGITNGIELESISLYITQAFNLKSIQIKEDTNTTAIKRRVKAFSKGIKTANKRLLDGIGTNNLFFYKKHLESVLKPLFEATIEPYLIDYFSEKVPSLKSRLCGKKKQTGPIDIKLFIREGGIRGKDLNQIENNYKGFLGNLVRWSFYVRSLSYWDCLLMERTYGYDGFFHYVFKYHCLPLPKVILRRWYSYGYQRIIDFLQLKGILFLKRDYYNPVEEKTYHENIKGICRYYLFEPLKFNDPLKKKNKNENF